MNQWTRVAHSHGQTILSLAFNYGILSLMTLSFGISALPIKVFRESLNTFAVSVTCTTAYFLIHQNVYKKNLEIFFKSIIFFWHFSKCFAFTTVYCSTCTVLVQFWTWFIYLFICSVIYSFISPQLREQPAGCLTSLSEHEKIQVVLDILLRDFNWDGEISVYEGKVQTILSIPL